jgi:hypothetical protein
MALDRHLSSETRLHINEHGLAEASGDEDQYTG